jgi:hypothetical protein
LPGVLVLQSVGPTCTPIPSVWRAESSLCSRDCDSLLPRSWVLPCQADTDALPVPGKISSERRDLVPYVPAASTGSDRLAPNGFHARWRSSWDVAERINAWFEDSELARFLRAASRTASVSEIPIHNGRSR